MKRYLTLFLAGLAIVTQALTPAFATERKPLVIVNGTTQSMPAGDTIPANTLPTATIDERARDAVGSALTAGTGISITPNDGADTITVSSTGGGTVTSVAALTLGTIGTDLSSSVANGTTTPVITLNVPTASAANRGALSAADWSTFNGKQAALTLGTGVQTALGVNIGSAGAPVLFNGAGGTPSSMTGTNITGLPIALGVSGLGTGVATALAAGKTGTGNVVLDTSPTLVTPTLGVAAGTSLALTPAANTSALTSTGYSLTGANAQSLVDLAGTWNTSGTPTAIKLNITNTTSNASSRLMSLQVGGTDEFYVQKNGHVYAANYIEAAGFYVLNGASGYFDLGILNLPNSGYVGWSSSSDGNVSADTRLYRDAANTLAQRNGTAAQAFRVYNTYTDASNYERLDLVWSSNIAYIQTTNGGTGSQRELRIGGSVVRWLTAGTSRWQINGSGHIVAEVDNTYDIGASGATRPRNGYFGSNVIAGSTFQVATSGYFGVQSRLWLRAPADGVVVLTNAAETDFSRLQFGGTTPSFPALKRSSATLQARLADDSADAGFTVAYVTTVATTVAGLPAAATAGAGARAFVTDASTTLILGLGLTAAGGGANKVPVYSDGTNWIVGANDPLPRIPANDNAALDARAA